MDECRIVSLRDGEKGTLFICKKWISMYLPETHICPLDFGVATRAYPGMGDNGDAFVIKKWESGGLGAVIDGLGHGRFARRAAQKARFCVEGSSQGPISEIFLRTQRDCRATRGVVMAAVAFDFSDLSDMKLSFASIGNIETRMFGSPQPVRFLVRRGILGKNAPKPIVTDHQWTEKNILVMHTDGLSSHWSLEDFPEIISQSANDSAQRLLTSLAKDSDDATVMVIKGRKG
jgi:serine/threonine protein phosphatase PrpC